MTREDINDIINAICPNDEDYEKPCISPKYLRQELEQLALDQKQWNEEPTTKNNLAVDCVSRILVQSAISKSIEYKENPYQLYKRIERLPSVTPQESKIGHWIPTYGNVKCSVCGSVKDSREVGRATHYCDFCGAKME